MKYDWHNIFIFFFLESPQVSTDAIAGGVIAAIVVISLLCVGGAIFAIVNIQRRKKYSIKCFGKVERTRYASLCDVRGLIQKLTLCVHVNPF